jgi:serine phosphatase RsbU (regulator of sigma subunit)
MQRRAQRYVSQARHFVRDYTAGLNIRDFRRLFDEDASRAYKVLTRDQEAGPEPRRDFRRLLFRLKVIFLGLSYKLTPARRALFVISLLLACLGLLRPPLLDFSSDQTHIHLDFSPLLFLTSIGGLVWLLVMELVDRVRVRDELEVARQLQSDLLPSQAPQIAGYSFAHSYRTANEVGGDYYDFQQLPDGRLALLMADASGHGIAAGLLMAIANATLKTALELDPEPEAVASLLNIALFRAGDRRAFMTLFYGLLDPESGRLDYICAGHPFPMLRRAGGEIVELGEGTLPLGLRQTVKLPRGSITVERGVPRGSITVERGDVLVLFTDGLPEAIDQPDGQAFGFDRVKDHLASIAGPKALHDRILLAFDEHVGHEPLTDDLTLVVMARSG